MVNSLSATYLKLKNLQGYCKIASAISITKSNIVDVSINRHKGSFFCTLKIGLEISHRVHLAEVLEI